MRTRLQKLIKRALYMTCAALVVANTDVQAQQDAYFSWARQLGGDSVCIGKKIITDASGNVYTAGIFRGTVDFDPTPNENFLTSAGSYDIFVTKLTSTGNFVWARHLGDGGEEQLKDMRLDANGNIYLVGNFKGTSDFDPGPNTAYFYTGAYENGFIVKLDNNGNYVWANQLEGDSTSSINSIDFDESGNIYLTGYFSGKIDVNFLSDETAELTSTGDKDIFLLKTTNFGGFLKAQRFGGNSTEEGVAIKVYNSSSYLIAGNYRGKVTFDGDSVYYAPTLVSAGASDGFLLYCGYNVDSSKWFFNASTYGGPGEDRIKAIAIAPDFNVYLAGTFNEQAAFNGQGTGNYLTSKGEEDIFILSTKIWAGTNWVRQLGGTSVDDVHDIAVSTLGGVYTIGSFRGVVDFNPITLDTATTYHLSKGKTDVFINALNIVGDFLWNTQIGGDLDDIGYGITAPNSGDIYSTGVFRRNLDFNQDPKVWYMMDGNTVGHAFTLKYAPVPLSFNDNGTIAQNNTMQLYPNPTSGAIAISLNKAITKGSVQIVNGIGQVVYTQDNLNGTLFNLNIQHLGSGIYYLQVKDAAKMLQVKVVKQ